MSTEEIMELIAQLQEAVERLSTNISSENVSEIGGWLVV